MLDKVAWIVAIVACALVAVLFFTDFTLAHHEHSGLVLVEKKRKITEDMGKAQRFHAVEACTGLYGPLPKIARSTAAPCPWDESEICLGNGWPYTGFYFTEEQLIVLPVGRSDAFEHESIHHLQLVNYGFISHGGAEFECE